MPAWSSVMKEATGNMYEFVDWMCNPIFGECPHHCTYCYVKTGRCQNNPNYKGSIRLNDAFFGIDLSSKGKQTIFVGTHQDLFASSVPMEMTRKVIQYCARFPENTYLFQSKNPRGFMPHLSIMPKSVILGITLETDAYPEGMRLTSLAPFPQVRAEDFAEICTLMRKTVAMHTDKHHAGPRFKAMVTIEPIIQFNLQSLVNMISDIKPSFCNIGADSKNCHLREPTPEQVGELMAELKKVCPDMRLKTNLERLVREK